MTTDRADILFQKKIESQCKTTLERVKFAMNLQNGNICPVNLKLFFKFDSEYIFQLDFSPFIYINRNFKDENLKDILSIHSNIDISNIEIINKIYDTENNYNNNKIYFLLFTFNNISDENHLKEIQNEILEWTYLINGQHLI